MKSNMLMLNRKKLAGGGEIRMQHTVVLCGQSGEFCTLNLMVHKSQHMVLTVSCQLSALFNGFVLGCPGRLVQSGNEFPVVVTFTLPVLQLGGGMEGGESGGKRNNFASARAHRR